MTCIFKILNFMTCIFKILFLGHTVLHITTYVTGIVRCCLTKNVNPEGLYLN
jgi:hypothetical protein